VKTLLAWARMIAVFLVVAVASELPPLKQAGQAIDRLHDPLLTVVIAVAALGFTVFMGGILSMLMASGEPMTHEEIEGAISQRQRAGEPYTWRVSAHRVFGVAAGRHVVGEASFAGMKNAWKSKEWRRDSQWRRLFVITTGAALLFYGLFGVFVVIGPPPIKVLMAAAMLYATVMTIWGFARARG
jgi:hypothetical protein